MDKNEEIAMMRRFYERGCMILTVATCSVVIASIIVKTTFMMIWSYSFLSIMGGLGIIICWKSMNRLKKLGKPSFRCW